MFVIFYSRYTFLCATTLLDSVLNESISQRSMLQVISLPLQRCCRIDCLEAMTVSIFGYWPGLGETSKRILETIRKVCSFTFQINHCFIWLSDTIVAPIVSVVRITSQKTGQFREEVVTLITNSAALGPIWADAGQSQTGFEAQAQPCIMSCGTHLEYGDAKVYKGRKEVRRLRGSLSNP